MDKYNFFIYFIKHMYLFYLQLTFFINIKKHVKNDCTFIFLS
jgi:hypothetical protein